MFYNCSSLSSLADISKWNIDNVIDMNGMFSFCSSLSSLPDISQWNTNNVKNMSWMFNCCSSLSSLPDISKWNTNKIINMSSMYKDCYSLLEYLELFKLEYNYVNLKYIFYNCSSLSSLPDISKWNINNVFDMHEMFSHCLSLLFIYTKNK